MNRRNGNWLAPSINQLTATAVRVRAALSGYHSIKALVRAKAAREGWPSSQISRARLTFREQLVGGFVQMPLGALSIWQVSNQLSGKLVNVHASEVIDLLSLEIEDGRPKDRRYADATAVEYFSVHDLPPIGGPAASAFASGSRATAPTTC